MSISASFEANTKAPELVGPRVSPVNHPAEFPEAATMFRATLCDYRLDAALAKLLTMRVGIVATIGIDNLGFLKRPAAHSTNRRDRVNERQQLGAAVAIRSGQDHADGNAVYFDAEVMFGTEPRDPWGSASFSPAPMACTDEASTAT